MFCASASIFGGFFWFSGRSCRRCLFGRGECDQLLRAHLSEKTMRIMRLRWIDLGFVKRGAPWSSMNTLPWAGFEAFAKPSNCRQNGDGCLCWQSFCAVVINYMVGENKCWLISMNSVCYPGQNRAVVNFCSRFFSLLSPVKCWYNTVWDKLHLQVMGLIIDHSFQANGHIFLKGFVGLLPYGIQLPQANTHLLRGNIRFLEAQQKDYFLIS